MNLRILASFFFTVVSNSAHAQTQATTEILMPGESVLLCESSPWDAAMAAKKIVSDLKAGRRQIVVEGVTVMAPYQVSSAGLASGTSGGNASACVTLTKQ